MTGFLRRARVGAAALVAFVLALLFAAPAGAQSLESVLSPGKVIQDHAKYEDDCRSCHIPLDKAAQDRLCQDCHKDIGADVRGKTGFHGRMKPQACRTCHTEHRGRDAKIAEFDKNTFDHQQTDFALRDAHRKVDCAKCHLPKKKYSAAPADCNGCHQKDDIHKGALGTKCADCHNEAKWKDVVKFDHSKTKFELTGKHVDAKCDSCHKDSKGQVRYKDTPKTCIGCHQKEDKHKGTYSEKCENCHNTRDWKTILFNHDKDTKFALRGKHRSPPLKCDSCHKPGDKGAAYNIYKDKPGAACIDCHKKDDKHKGTLGNKCGDCHSERDWKEPAGFDHDKTKFPLLGKHQKVECKDCHKTAVFNEAPSTCIGCHKKDDKHAGNLGEQCADCHNERDWKQTPKFDHDKTKFKLRNAHASPKPLKCDSCHKDLKSFRKTPMECYACHKKDDKHEGQQGKECDQCHNDKDWKTTTFDHGRTKFPLTGLHIKVECKKCHETSRFKDAKTECFACHKKDDKHKLKFGEQCQKCHATRGWKIWEFDHDRKTKYKLEGGHRRAACESCHTAPAPRGKDAAPVGTSCIGCHRADDVHDGAFGTNCERCHGLDDWKRVKPRLGGLGNPHEAGWGMEQRGWLSDASEAVSRIDWAGVVLGDASYFARRRQVPRMEQDR